MPEDLPVNLIELLSRQAKAIPDRLAFGYLKDGRELSEQFTFAQLHRRALSIAAGLQRKNLQGQRALLLFPAGIEVVAAFFGCMYAGVIAVPAPAPEASRLKRSGPRLQAIIADSTARLVLCTTDMLPLLRELYPEGANGPEVIATDALPDANECDWSRPDIQPSGLAYLQYSSGSTSSPKGVAISHFNLIWHVNQMKSSHVYGPESVTVTWMPYFHDWGLVEGLILPISNGTPCYIMSPFSFVRRPENWLRAITEYRATHSQGPNFAYEHCVRRVSDTDGVDLSSWYFADVAAEPIQFQVLQQFHEKFQGCGFRWESFSPSFGLAEATLKVTNCHGRVQAHALNLDPSELEQGKAVQAKPGKSVRTLVSCGLPFGDTRVLIVDPGTRLPKAEGLVGEIWVQDPANAQGYWQNAAETKSVFDARLAESSDGPFMRTGDMGFLQDGELYIAGRLNETIIIRGSNHYPQDIEWTAQRVHAAVQGQTGAAFSIETDGRERLVLVQEVDHRLADQNQWPGLGAKVVREIADEHELEVYDLMFVPRATIPKTASGKIQRRACREQYLHDELTKVAHFRAKANARAQEEENMSGSSDLGPADQLVTWLREYGSRRVNSFLMDERRCVPPYIILDFARQGLFGLQIPGEQGGLDLGFQDTRRILEQLAAIDFSLATLVFLSNANALRPLINFAKPDLREQLFPDLAMGRSLAAFGLSEPEAGSNVGGIRTTATKVAEGEWEISGVKRWNGSAWAEWITVIARERDQSGNLLGTSAFVVRQSDPGVEIGPESLTMGLRCIMQNSLALNRVRVTADRQLGKSGQGFEIANDALAVGRLWTATVCLGAAKRTLQLLMSYARNRVIATGWLYQNPVFQKSVGDHVAQAAIVDLLCQFLAGQMDKGETLPAWQAMCVKVLASEGFNACTATAMQFAGGRAYMENNEIARLFRDARSLSVGEGPNESLIGYLGQPNNCSLIVRWLEESHQDQLAIHLREACEKILSACQAQCERSPAFQHHWAHYLCGAVGMHSFAVAVARMSSSRYSPWATARLMAITIHHNHLATVGPTDAIPGNWQEEIDEYQQQIGRVLQSMPGEDLAMDPLFLTGFQGQRQVAAIETPPAMPGPSTDTTGYADNRARLAEILKRRSARPQ